MAKLYSVRIDEINGSDFTRIGKKMPLRDLEEVRDFLVQYTTTWQQLPPPAVAEIEREFEEQRVGLLETEGPPLPGIRKCEFTLKPYEGSDIEHCITITEMSGTLSEMGEQAVLLQGVPATIRERTCRVCGCTESDCRHCVAHTGAPCHWVGPHLCSACTPQETPMAETQWALSFAQAAVIEAVTTAQNHWDHRRHDERFHLRVVHRNERDYFVYLTIAKGELVSDEKLFELGWQAREVVQKGGLRDG
jgi:hypothetical protein